MVERLEQLATCPLCGGPFEDPVLLACEHSFCRACLARRWGTPPAAGTEASPTACPCCGLPCPRRSLRSNVRLAVEVRISRGLREKLAEPGARAGRRRGGRIPTMGSLDPHGEVRPRCASRVPSCWWNGKTHGFPGEARNGHSRPGTLMTAEAKDGAEQRKAWDEGAGADHLSSKRSEKCREGRWEGVDTLPRGRALGYLSRERAGSREGWSTGRSASRPWSPREGRGHCGSAGRDAVRRQEEESRRGDGEAAGVRASWWPGRVVG